MNFVALKMLIGDRAKYFGIIVGLTFASLLIAQQAGIFIGLMTRTYGAISDLGLPDIWVMDPKVQFIDDVKPLQDTQLFRVRGVDGVAWAVPLYKGLIKARLANGTFQTCNVLGLDDETLIGGPPEMIKGDGQEKPSDLSELRQADAVIVDLHAASDKLAKENPDGTKSPLRIGDMLELNDHRAIIVGFCRVGRTFQSQPVLYTTFSRATQFAPKERKLLSFVLVKAKSGQDMSALCKRIESATRLAAYTSQGFKDLTFWYFMKNTGIPLNFGIAVALGFMVGTLVAGQTFYNFTLDNLRHFGTLKAMGAGNGTLLRMIVLQSLMVGGIGYGIGVGLAAFMGTATGKTELSFLLPWWLLVGTGVAILFICVIASIISIHKVMKLEPAIVFKS